MRYEIRTIDTNEMKRVAIYSADEITIKTDNYGYWITNEDHEEVKLGKTVGFRLGGSKRKMWVHTVRYAVQIIDSETGEVTYLKSQEDILRELGREDLIRP